MTTIETVYKTHGDEMKAQGYVVIYTVRGERHRDMQVFSTLEGAKEHLAIFRRDGWNAWIEEL